MTSLEGDSNWPPNNSPDCVKSRAGGDLSHRASADVNRSGARVLCRRAILASSGNAIRDFRVFAQPLARLWNNRFAGGA